MVAASDFTTELEAKVANSSSRSASAISLGAAPRTSTGAATHSRSTLGPHQGSITDVAKRDDIQAKLDGGAKGIEQALDLLDDGGATDTPYRHIVTDALAELFMAKTPPLDCMGEFVRRIAQHAEPGIKVFSLNYDPLIERAAAHVRVRVIDGYLGAEHSYFDPAVFAERIGRIRGTHKGKQFDETVTPIHLLKLHGSLGWYECPTNGVRRCGFGVAPPAGTKRLMVPPQRRKAADTMIRRTPRFGRRFAVAWHTMPRPSTGSYALGTGSPMST
ncbi:MAG: hypothetical protein IPG76_21630 [Acidobacteria bacterium]|nr:hypothetical protein [Acidobacteriota bacterium]